MLLVIFIRLVILFGLILLIYKVIDKVVKNDFAEQQKKMREEFLAAKNQKEFEKELNSSLGEEISDANKVIKDSQRREQFVKRFKK